MMRSGGNRRTISSLTLRIWERVIMPADRD